MTRRINLSLCLLFLQSIQFLGAQSMRGLSPVNGAICWASGSKGTVVKTEVGGEIWDTVGPKEYVKKDFRDIHAYDAEQAIVMSSGEDAVVIRTEDGGKSWTTVLHVERKGVFLDAMDFSGAYGVIIGDTYLKRKGLFRKKLVFDMYFSCDSGRSWECKTLKAGMPEYEPEKGEALFAASGSNIRFYYPQGDSTQMPQLAFISRGKQAKFYFSDQKVAYAEATESSGPYSMSLNAAADTLVIVGGDWKNQDAKQHAGWFAHGDLKNLLPASVAPAGYRSSVCRAEEAGNVVYVCTGPKGSDYSLDGGKTWKPIQSLEGGFNVVAWDGNFLWFIGNDGALEKKWLWEIL